MPQKINLVWFKRDLRINDHRPLSLACQADDPALLIYIFEPEMVQNPHYSDRHWRFVWESLSDIQAQLSPHHHVHIFYDDPLQVFKQLASSFEIGQVFSYEETGILESYQRDLRVQDWFKCQGISWNESPTNAVYRPLTNRSNWRALWKSRIMSEFDDPQLEKLRCVKLPEFLKESNTEQDIPHRWKQRELGFQQGGELEAWDVMASFFDERCAIYKTSISKPNESRKGCSRISPYLAWGNISLKQVHAYFRTNYPQSTAKRALKSFESRLHWHCHFIQKFESECRMETENVNRGYDTIRTEVNVDFVEPWKLGKTGYPLVDACMRAVCKTGYLNFRMRSMLVSFLTHHLWQPWQAGAPFLAQQFLDFEPGIHYPQFQMQAGTTGTNTIRIYNPIKQSMEHDPEGVFIKEFVPELKNVPKELIHEPWNMSSMEQQMYDCVLGKQYPFPIVDVKTTYKEASSALWAMKANPAVKEEARRIKRIHIKPGRRSA